MSATTFETIIRWLGAVLLLITLALLLIRCIAALRRSRQFSRLGWLGLGITILTGLVWVLWKPVPIHLTPTIQTFVMIAGGILLLAGLGLTIWGQAALGDYTFTFNESAKSPSQRLVKDGPYGIIRHPMYLGAFLAGVGGLLVYQTWIWLLAVILTIGLIPSGRAEEIALLTAYSDSWKRYQRRVPLVLPRLQRSKAGASPVTHLQDSDDSPMVTVKTIVILTAAMVIFVCMIGGLGVLFGYRNYQSAVLTQTAAPISTQSVSPPGN